MPSSRIVVCAVLATACWLASVVLAQPCNGQIRVNELLADPGIDWNGDTVVSFKDDEWVEIVNTSATPVDLANLRLSDGGTRALRYGFSGTLAPGAVRVVYGSDSVAWESANSLGSSGLSLNNAGDQVRLWSIAGTDTLLVDSYTYVAFEVLNDRAPGRVPDGADTWQLFDGLNPYTGSTPPLGTGCNPTPGQRNVCPTPVEPVTWGDVKRIFAVPEPGPR